MRRFFLGQVVTVKNDIFPGIQAPKVRCEIIEIDRGGHKGSFYVQPVGSKHKARIVHANQKKEEES